MSDLVDKTKQHFLNTFAKSDPAVRLYDKLPKHVATVAKWAEHILKQHPEADRDVVLASVWLHDIGQLIGPREEDHAVRSEREVMKFVQTTGISKDLVNAIAHCVRAHRCKDVQPQTIEAKIIAAADSASHFTDATYVDMIEKLSLEGSLAKMERDYRDVGLLSEVKKQIAPLYEAWKSVLNNYPKL
jgi:23S rRNA maturation-related 3'-5' exoribonuclease YhaM